MWWFIVEKNIMRSEAYISKRRKINFWDANDGGEGGSGQWMTNETPFVYTTLYVILSYLGMRCHVYIRVIFYISNHIPYLHAYSWGVVLYIEHVVSFCKRCRFEKWECMCVYFMAIVLWIEVLFNLMLKH